MIANAIMIPDGPDHILITAKGYSVRVLRNAFVMWKYGALIQHCMPDLNAEQREFLISGTTPAEWNAMFGDGEA